MVDLPAPEGPEMTMGWLAERASLEAGTGSVGAMVGGWVVKVRIDWVLNVGFVGKDGSEGWVRRRWEGSFRQLLRDSFNKFLEIREKVNGMPSRELGAVGRGGV